MSSFDSHPPEGQVTGALLGGSAIKGNDGIGRHEYRLNIKCRFKIDLLVGAIPT